MTFKVCDSSDVSDSYDSSENSDSTDRNERRRNKQFFETHFARKLGKVTFGHDYFPGKTHEVHMK